MTGQQILFLLIVFAVVAGLAVAASLIFFPGTLRRRLFGATAPVATSAAAPDTGWVERVARVAQPFSKLSLPEEGWERSPLRTRFMNAGWRQASAPALYFAAKSVLALLFPTLLGLYAASSMAASVRSVLLFFLCVSAAIGYYLPNLVLASTARRRQRDIFENIPDALDLLTVCVEAGLSLERALVKVSGEIHIKSMVLAQELQLVLMEMRAGFTKERRCATWPCAAAWKTSTCWWPC